MRDPREVAAALGLPGLLDLHTHVLPPQVMAKVRAQFDAAGPLIGREWPLFYRDDDEALAQVLRSFGVLRWTALPYAHRTGRSASRSAWAANSFRMSPIRSSVESTVTFTRRSLPLVRPAAGVSFAAAARGCARATSAPARTANRTPATAPNRTTGMCDLAS